jgi:hypothetical protein
VRTTDTLRREIASLEERIEIRFAALDKARELSRATLLHYVDEERNRTAALKELQIEKFEAVKAQLYERDLRSKMNYEAATEAVKTAMNAQKELNESVERCNREAIAKSEASTQKQMDAINTQLGTVAGAITDKIDAINSRLNRGEGMQTGKASDAARNLAIGALVIAAFGVAIAYVNSQRLTSSPQYSQSFSTPVPEHYEFRKVPVPGPPPPALQTP